MRKIPSLYGSRAIKLCIPYARRIPIPPPSCRSFTSAVRSSSHLRTPLCRTRPYQPVLKHFSRSLSDEKPLPKDEDFADTGSALAIPDAVTYYHEIIETNMQYQNQLSHTRALFELSNDHSSPRLPSGTNSSSDPDTDFNTTLINATQLLSKRKSACLKAIDDFLALPEEQHESLQAIHAQTGHEDPVEQVKALRFEIAGPTKEMLDSWINIELMMVMAVVGLAAIVIPMSTWGQSTLLGEGFDEVEMRPRREKGKIVGPRGYDR